MHGAVELIGQKRQHLPLPVKPRDTVKGRRRHAHPKMRLALGGGRIMTGMQMRLVNNLNCVGCIGGGEFFFYNIAYHDTGLSIAG